jgi:protein tyrosine phosphatase (PTP) superfamily phosphohydrolase (DUF442 family)
VARLAALGVRHVVNLALETHPEALADEGAKLAGQGIAYTHIPVPFDAPGEAHFAAFRKALEEGPRPVHVHCIMNWRVSAFFYRCTATSRHGRTGRARSWNASGRPKAATGRRRRSGRRSSPGPRDDRPCRPHVVITGASTGIGRASARCAQAGAAVTLIARRGPAGTGGGALRGARGLRRRRRGRQGGAVAALDAAVAAHGPIDGLFSTPGSAARSRRWKTIRTMPSTRCWR